MDGFTNTNTIMTNNSTTNAISNKNERAMRSVVFVNETNLRGKLEQSKLKDIGFTIRPEQGFEVSHRISPEHLFAFIKPYTTDLATAKQESIIISYDEFGISSAVPSSDSEESDTDNESGDDGGGGGGGGGGGMPMASITSQARWTAIFNPCARELIVDAPESVKHLTRASTCALFEIAEGLGAERIFVPVPKAHEEFQTLVRGFLFFGFRMVSPGALPIPKTPSREGCVILEYDQL